MEIVIGVGSAIGGLIVALAVLRLLWLSPRLRELVFRRESSYAVAADDLGRRRSLEWKLTYEQERLQRFVDLLQSLLDLDAQVPLLTKEHRRRAKELLSEYHESRDREGEPHAEG